MPDDRRILTVHSPVPPGVLDELLSSIEDALVRAGATRVWLDCRWSPELVVMAELPGCTAYGSVASTACDESGHVSAAPRPR